MQLRTKEMVMVMCRSSAATIHSVAVPGLGNFGTGNVFAEAEEDCITSKNPASRATDVTHSENLGTSGLVPVCAERWMRLD